jgi:hypothetical protein
MEAENPVAVAGHNQPPPTPYEAAKARIDDLYQQARDYLDGDPIATEGQAADVQRLMRMIGEEITVADALRAAEKKPFDDAAAEVQARWNALIGKNKSITGTAVRAKEACAEALAPWLRKIDEEQEAARKAAREEADRLKREAEEAIRNDPANIAAREEAERKVAEAKAAEATAKRAEKARPTAGSYGRAAGLRTYYDAVVTDGRAFHAWCVKHDREAMTAYLARRAQELVDANRRDMDGVDVKTRKEVR